MIGLHHPSLGTVPLVSIPSVYQTSCTQQTSQAFLLSLFAYCKSSGGEQGHQRYVSQSHCVCKRSLLLYYYTNRLTGGSD